MSANQHDDNSSSTPQGIESSKTDVVDAQSGSALNAVLWIFAVISFFGATIVNTYLPGYWQPASSVWVRLAVIVGLVVLGLVFLFLTRQGKGFFKLLSDARIELRRVTWPGREETVEYTWKVLVVMIISGFLVWALDGLLNPIIGSIIG